METHSKVDGRVGRCRVVALDSNEERIVAASFLRQVASGLLLVVLLFLTVGLLISSGDTRWLYYLVGPLLFFLAWSLALDNMWRSVILIASLICFPPLLGLGVSNSINEYFHNQLPGFFLLPLLFATFLSGRVLSDGLLLGATPDAVSRLFVAAVQQKRDMRQMIAAQLGIHPICRYLPGGWRRLIVGGLSVLAAGFTGLTIYIMLTGLADAQLTAVLFGGVSAGLAGILRYFSHFFARVSVKNLADVDKRPPILFLRSFQDEQVELDRPKRGFIRAFVGLGEPHPILDHVLLEEFTQLGPVEAIGKPGAGVPFGAARAYASDDEWRNVVAKLARDASAIVLVVDDTQGVNWELLHLVASGHLPKTLCLLPPRFAIYSDQFAKRTEEAAQMVRNALLHNGCTIDAPIQKPCIGWYRVSQGNMVLLVSDRPSKASYVCALRLFREYQRSGYVPD